MSIICRFRSAEGEGTGPQLDVPVETTAKELALILNKLLASDEVLPYSFYVGGEEVATTLGAALGDASVEQVLEVTYVPQAVFRVKSVTRCTSTLAGHADAILHVTFSPDGRHLATGSGDATVRLWDLTTETPRFTLRGHGDWVLCTAWSPDGRMLATGGKDGTLFVWDAVRGRAAGPGLSGHRKFLTALSWEPMHSNARCELLASASKDLLIKLWNWRTGRCLHQLSGHTASVTCLRWGGQGLIYSGSQDRTVKVWVAAHGTLARSLEGHGHWVNCLAVSTDHALRCGTFDHRGRDLSRGRGAVGAVGMADAAAADAAEEATARVAASRAAVGAADASCELQDAAAVVAQSAPPGVVAKRKRAPAGEEEGGRGASGMVDASLALPDEAALAARAAASLARYDALRGSSLRGDDAIADADADAAPQSADGASVGDEMLASCSDDFTAFLWRPASSKKPVARLQGHQRPINALAFAPDGRLLATASFDGSVRLWRSADGKFVAALRGHVGPVYQVGWSGDSRLVVSGSRDSTMKVWDVASRKLKVDLPGHADEVFAVDWSPDGQRVASGGKDKMLKFWRA